MKHISISLLAISFLLLSNIINPEYISAQGSLTAPVDLDIPMPPTPVKADGKIHLFYELHITNFRPQNLELTSVEIYKDEANIKPLASYKDTELINRLARPGAPPDLPDKRVIIGGMRAVVFLQIIVNTEADLPRSLHHPLFF